MAKTEVDNASAGEPPKLRGAAKAAILLLHLDGDVAASVLRHLDDAMVEDITREIAQIDLVSPNDRGRVVEEFYNTALAQSYAEQGGLGYAKLLLQKTMPPEQASHVIKLLEHQVHLVHHHTLLLQLSVSMYFPLI